mmetsp:Transcript_8197/g.32301  ORF Transcript_8197/g.32301 Transcript_8197/m.32301 type:complete len:489 (+) Transcript_8197:1794-3260(+)
MLATAAIATASLLASAVGPWMRGRRAAVLRGSAGLGSSAPPGLVGSSDPRLPPALAFTEPARKGVTTEVSDEGVGLLAPEPARLPGLVMKQEVTMRNPKASAIAASAAASDTAPSSSRSSGRAPSGEASARTDDGTLESPTGSSGKASHQAASPPPGSPDSDCATDALLCDDALGGPHTMSEGGDGRSTPQTPGISPVDDTSSSPLRRSTGGAVRCSWESITANCPWSATSSTPMPTTASDGSADAMAEPGPEWRGGAPQTAREESITPCSRASPTVDRSTTVCAAARALSVALSSPKTATGSAAASAEALQTPLPESIASGSTASAQAACSNEAFEVTPSGSGAQRGQSEPAAQSPGGGHGAAQTIVPSNTTDPRALSISKAPPWELTGPEAAPSRGSAESCVADRRRASTLVRLPGPLGGHPPLGGGTTALATMRAPVTKGPSALKPEAPLLPTSAAPPVDSGGITTALAVAASAKPATAPTPARS